MQKTAQELEQLFEKLLSDHPQKNWGNYQLPVKVGKAGQSIDEGDKPWIVGTFLPGQFVNDRHPQGHDGIDLKAPKGTPVYPIGPGIVLEVKEWPKGGKTCKISHEEGKVTSYYAHMDKVAINPKQEVLSNTVIGYVGDTGNAKGSPHLHFEVKVNNAKVNPMGIIGKAVGSLSGTQKLASLVLMLGGLE